MSYIVSAISEITMQAENQNFKRFEGARFLTVSVGGGGNS